MTLNPYPHYIDQPGDWKNIVKVIEERFTKIEDSLIGLKTQQFSLKNEKQSLGGFL